MKTQDLFIPVLLGTYRTGRESEKPARLVFDEVEKRGIETEFIDLREQHLPNPNYGTKAKDEVPEWRATMERADGLIIVTPEYNHGYPGPLKTLLDTLYDEYNHKAVGMVTVSSGPWAGARVLEGMLPVVRALGMFVHKTDLLFPNVPEHFDEEGNLTNMDYLPRIDHFLQELVWLTKTLKHGRENIDLHE